MESGICIEMQIKDFANLMGIETDKTKSFYTRIKNLTKELVKKVVSIKTEKGFITVRLVFQH